MTRSSKKRRIALTKSRAGNGTFTAKNHVETNFEEEIGVEDLLEVENWGDDNDSEWEEDVNLMLEETNHKRLLGVKFRNITYLLKTFEICIKFRKIL